MGETSVSPISAPPCRCPTPLLNLDEPGGCPADDRRCLPPDASSLSSGVGSLLVRRPRTGSSAVSLAAPREGPADRLDAPQVDQPRKRRRQVELPPGLRRAAV